MLFVVQFEDVYADQPHRLPERAQHMADHLAFLAGHGAGPFSSALAAWA